MDIIAKPTICRSSRRACISANAAGQDVDDELIASVKSGAPDVGGCCNTGCRPDTNTERKLTTADAAVVGTYFKEGYESWRTTSWRTRVDVNRVKEFMEVGRFRGTCNPPPSSYRELFFRIARRRPQPLFLQAVEP